MGWKTPSIPRRGQKGMCELAQKKNRKRNEDRPFSSSFFALLCTYSLSFVTSCLERRRRRRIEGLANWVIRRNGRTWGEKEESFVHFDREGREAV